MIEHTILRALFYIPSLFYNPYSDESLEQKVKSILSRTGKKILPYGVIIENPKLRLPEVYKSRLSLIQEMEESKQYDAFVHTFNVIHPNSLGVEGMKILHISDTHAGAESYFDKLSSIVNSALSMFNSRKN